MMRFEGERVFSGPPSQVWAKLRDASFLVGCIPDADIEGTAERDRAVCSVRPGFAFARGTIEVTISLVDAAEPASARFKVLSKGIGSSTEVEATLSFTAQEPGTKVRWAAEVKNLGGLLKAVPSGLIRGAAQKVIDDVWNSVAAKLA